MRRSRGMRRELLTLSDATVNNIEIGDICWVNYPYEENAQKDANGDSTWGKVRPALVINKNINEARPIFVLKGTTSHNQSYNQSENIRYIDRMRFNCNSIAMLKPHHILRFIDHIDFHDQRFQDILKTAYKIHKHNRLVFSTYEDYIMNTDRRHINMLNEANSKSIIKSNCRWDEVYAIYNTLLPHEKLYLGNRFIDSPNTVFRWIVKRNTENAGFIELYDMKKPGSHRGELIVTVAIWEKYRGMGGLRELQDAAEKFVSSSSKYNRLIWLAKDANKKSIHCAEKLGYTKKFHELDHWVFDKTIESKELLDESNESFLSLNFYHASPSKYDKVIKPIAPNYGTKLYGPHWAVYMWKDKSLAYPYCLFTYIHKFMQKNFSKEERKDKLFECIKYGIYYMTKDVYEALKEHCVGKIAYIYTINVPLKDFIHIKLGHTNDFPEYSLDKEATIINREEIKITEKYFDKYVVVTSVSNIKKLKKELAKEKEKNPTNILYNTKDDAYKVSYKFYIANAHGYLDTNKDLNEVLSNDELMIEAFNKELNTADYGIIINGKVYTGKNIDWRKYKTISPKDFEKYFAGTCWDYAEYEAKQFEEVFGFKHTLNDLKEKEYSMYYMQIDDNNTCPTHTWIVYKLNGKIYLFESSWMKYQGITEYNTEEEMVKDYIKKHRKEKHDKDNPIIVTKYKPNEKFGLTPKEFMVRCIYQGKVIYSEINSIPVDKS